MDSVPVRSESTDPGAGFGLRMALRVQPRVAPIRRRVSRPLVGAVGRASVGFSRAIGRAQAVRPVVGLSDLNTATLRPPPGFWRTDEGDAAGAFAEAGVNFTHAATSRAAIASAAAGTSVRSAASRANGAAGSALSADHPASMSWTDRLLAPSVRPTGSVRSTSQRRVDQVHRQSAPVEPFVASGSARFDVLRRMIAEGVTPDVRPDDTTTRRDSAPVPSVRAPKSTPTQISGAVPGQETSQERATVAKIAAAAAAARAVTTYSASGRDATQAGPSTAPGRFSERLLPEAIGEAGVNRSTQRPMPQRPTTDVSAHQVSASTRTAGPTHSDRNPSWPQRSLAASDSPHSNASPAQQRQRSSDIVERSIQRRVDSEASRRTSRHPEPAVAPGTRMDKLQAFLEERGDLPSSGELRPANDERRFRADETAASPRTGRDRAPAADVGQRVPRSDLARSDSPQSAPTRGNDLVSRVVAGEDAVSPSADTKRIVDGAESLGATPVADARSHRMQLADRRLQRLISQHPLGSAATAEARAEAGSALLEGAGSSSNLDVQRSVSGEFASVADQVGHADGQDQQQDMRSVAPPNIFGNETTAGPAVAERGLDRMGLATRLVPQLDGDTLRRVSLPMALSTAHRPHNSVALRDGAIHRVLSSPQSLTAMAATMNLAVGAPTAIRPGRPDAEQRSAELIDSATDSPILSDRLIPSVSTVQRRVDDRESTGHLQARVAHPHQTQAGASSPGGAAAVDVRPDDVANFSSAMQSPAARLEQVRRQAASPLVRALHSVDDIAVAKTSATHARVGRPPLSDSPRRDVTSADTSAPHTSAPHTSAPHSGLAFLAAEDRPGQSVQRSVSAESNVASVSDAAVETTEDAMPGVARRPAEDLAERFLGQLAASVQRRPAPLPVSYQPMADVIASGQRVMFSSDGASRRALRSVGKVAATTNNVIHIDRSATSPRMMDEVIAHELTHVAHPSAAPRFFDDIDDSPEERQAEAVARVMARSPLAPSSSTVAPPATVGGAGPRARIQRRSAGPEGASGGSESTISASAMAASITQTQQPNNVQRFASGPQSASGGSLSKAASPTETRQRDMPSTPSIAQQLGESAEAAEWFVDQLQRNFHRLVSDLEAQMIVELERRGGHHWRGL